MAARQQKTLRKQQIKAQKAKFLADVKADGDEEEESKGEHFVKDANALKLMS